MKNCNREFFYPIRVTHTGAFMTDILFQRYSEIITDFDLFLESLTRPLPVHLRVNSLKVEPSNLVSMLKEKGIHLKPTTRMIQIFGHHAVRALLDIQSDDINKMADGKHVSTDMEIDNGYIILSIKGAILGLGLFIDGKVTSQIPRRDIISFD